MGAKSQAIEAHLQDNAWFEKAGYECPLELILSVVSTIRMTPERLPTIRLYFCFHGELDPDEITRRLGIKPTTHFRPGDPITKDARGDA